MVKNATNRAMVEALLRLHGRGFAEELGIDLSSNTPSPLFRWLCACLLMSVRISSGLALRGARALAEHGWTTAQAMAATTWRQRVEVLNTSGYARFDEKTSGMLGEMADRLLEEYQGDLRRLRQASNGDPVELRKRLKAIKGMGDVGVDIFFREVQLVWDELYPFVDGKVREAARELELPAEPEKLARSLDRKGFVRLVSALVRTSLARDYDEVRKVAATMG